MSDTERVYSLYVQANPIPDPQRLLATSDEAELLLIEGSRDMDTKERIEVPKPAPRRRVAAIVFAAVIVVAGAIAGIGWLVSDGEERTVAGVDIAPGPATEAIEDLHEVRFDGQECMVSGPSEVPAGDRSFVLRDMSEEQPAGLQLAIRELVEGHTFQDLVDSQNEYGDGPGTYFGRPGWVYDVSVRDFTPDTDLGPHRHFLEVTLDPGTHAVIVWTPSGGEPIWLCAPLDVVDK